MVLVRQLIAYRQMVARQGYSHGTIATGRRVLDEQGLGEVSQVEALSVGDIAAKSPPYLK